MIVDLDMTCAEEPGRVCFGSHPLPFFHFFSSKEVSILHLYSSVFSSLFRAGLRREGLRSAQRLNNIPPISSPLCVRNSEKEIFTALSRLPCVGSMQNITRTNSSHHRPVSTLTHSCRPQILRSAMMFLSTCFSLSLRIRTACLFGDGRETKKKVSFLKITAL